MLGLVECRIVKSWLMFALCMHVCVRVSSSTSHLLAHLTGKTLGQVSQRSGTHAATRPLVLPAA
jgi:hypothetical protein